MSDTKETTETESHSAISLVVERNWDGLEDDLKWILGRPNFQCGVIARQMRTIGYECPPKAEMEQSMVIHTLLKFYFEHGDNWRDEFEKHVRGV